MPDEHTWMNYKQYFAITFAEQFRLLRCTLKYNSLSLLRQCIEIIRGRYSQLRFAIEMKHLFQKFQQMAYSCLEAPNSFTIIEKSKRKVSLKR